MDIKIKDIAGTSYKGINLEYWGGLQGFLDATSNGASGGMATAQQLRQVVPWLAKATDMTANAVASLPFDITNESGDIVDSSDDWKNKTGGMEIPSQIFQKLAASLCLGKAYLIPRYTSKYIVDLQYVAPHTITPEITAEGLKWLDRSTERGKFERYYPIDSKQKPEMMYFWLPDSDVEIGPALSYPAGAALLSARLLFSMDGTIQTYSERGFVPATILSAKGMPGQGEREKAERWWNKFLRGWTTEAAKIMNAEAMDIKQVGAGMEQLKGAYSELTKQAIENVGTAYGIPAALFMSDMAYASEANAMIKVWYETSAFVKIYSTIENTFNQQLFGKYGLKMSFHPETLDVFSQDEVANANAFKVYVESGILPSVASKLVGLELPEGITPEMLDAQVERKQKMEEEAARVNAEAQMAKLQAVNGDKPKEKIEEKPVKGWVTLEDGRRVLLDDEYDASDGVVEGKPVSIENKQPWQMTRNEFYNHGYVTERVKPTTPRAGLHGNIGSGMSEITLPTRDAPKILDAQTSPRVVNPYDGTEMFFDTAKEAAQYYKELHRATIERAISEGKDVPRNVLAEYPDLLAKYKPGKSLSLTAEQIKELNLWRQISERNERKGKGRATDFECKHLPDDVQIDIRKKLASDIPVVKAFEITNTVHGIDDGGHYDVDALKALAEAINKATDAPEVKAQPTSYTFNIPSPTIEQPSITVTVPEQPAPIVNVSSPEVKVINEVSPTPVNIENNIDIPTKEKLTVKRDAKGNITGMEKS